MAKFSSAEYFGFDEFIRTALRRVEAGKISADEAHSHVLHALTAYDRGNDTEVAPYMIMVRDKWTKADQADEDA
jgi:hypothetical protein